MPTTPSIDKSINQQINKSRVVAISATYRRPAELLRLAESLAKLTQPLLAWIVVDNAGDVDAQAIESALGTRLIRLAPEGNLGCGGALKAAEEMALREFGNGFTHLWILDDDAVVEPDSLAVMLAAMEREHAVASYPAVLDFKGHYAWTPGISPRAVMMALKKPHTPADYVARWGPEPLRFSWAQGVALLITREALEKYGTHRDDYWVRGEDLEFTLRITRHEPGIFVPTAIVAHLPPPNPPHSTSSAGGEFAKHLAHVQNLIYTSLRLPHGTRMIRTIPGNLLHYFRCQGIGPQALWHLAITLWRGAILGHPAGVGKKPGGGSQ